MLQANQLNSSDGVDSGVRVEIKSGSGGTFLVPFLLLMWEEETPKLVQKHFQTVLCTQPQQHQLYPRRKGVGGLFANATETHLHHTHSMPYPY